MVYGVLDEALEHFLEALKRGAYFDAHEILEEAWHPLRQAKDPVAKVVRGLINGAIAFEHLKRNRPQAKTRACRVWVGYERSKAHFNREMQTKHKGISLAYESVEALKASCGLCCDE
jgi:hypothetical protein